MLLRTLAEFAKVGEVGISKLVWFERETGEINVLGMPLFIYLFYSWFYFVWGFLCACVEGIRRDELLLGLIRVIRRCLNYQPLWGCYLGNIYFKAGETSEATKCNWVSQLPSVLNQWCCTIFFRISPHTHTVLLQQGIKQHAPCMPLKAGIGKNVLSSELRSTIISQYCRWLCAGPWDRGPAGTQKPACTEGTAGWGP